MPSTKEKKFPQRATVPDRYGAGGEPPAPPPVILESVPDDIRCQLPDDVVAELLAGATCSCSGQTLLVSASGLGSSMTPHAPRAGARRGPGSDCWSLDASHPLKTLDVSASGQVVNLRLRVDRAVARLPPMAGALQGA